MVMPGCASTFAVAGIGPVSISDRVVADDGRARWMRARGRSPSAAARSSLISSSALAPSVIWEELPAVTFQSIVGERARVISSVPNAGCSPASLSTVVPGRIVSSR